MKRPRLDASMRRLMRRPRPADFIGGPPRTFGLDALKDKVTDLRPFLRNNPEQK